MPERKERQEARLFMRRCPVCERWAPYESCYGDSEVGEHDPVTTESIEVRPASESDSLRRVLEELREAAEDYLTEHEPTVLTPNPHWHEAGKRLWAAVERAEALSQTTPGPEEEFVSPEGPRCAECDHKCGSKWCHKQAKPRSKLPEPGGDE